MRDYGLPTPTPVEGAVPEWRRVTTPCPNCGAALCEVTLEVTMPQLRGNLGVCVFLGCPACPYASPSVTRSLASGGEA